MINMIDKSLFDIKAYNLLASIFLSMEQVIHRYDAIEREVCSHHVSPDHIVSLGWDMIDWSERLRKLLDVGRSLKKRDDWFQEIIIHLGELKDVRNFIQHFDREIGKGNQNHIELIGSLKVSLSAKHYPHKSDWIFRAENSPEILFLQQQNRISNFEMLTMSGEIISSASLSLGGKEIDLNQLRGKVGQARNSLNLYLLENYYKTRKPAAPGFNDPID